MYQHEPPIDTMGGQPSWGHAASAVSVAHSADVSVLDMHGSRGATRLRLQTRVRSIESMQTKSCLAAKRATTKEDELATHTAITTRSASRRGRLLA
jgi:hypothetical protein